MAATRPVHIASSQPQRQAAAGAAGQQQQQQTLAAHTKLQRSVTLPSATQQFGTTLTSLTVRRQRNLATAERARIRLQCLHQVRSWP